MIAEISNIVIAQRATGSGFRSWIYFFQGLFFSGVGMSTIVYKADALCAKIPFDFSYLALVHIAIGLLNLSMALFLSPFCNNYGIEKRGENKYEAQY